MTVSLLEQYKFICENTADIEFFPSFFSSKEDARKTGIQYHNYILHLRQQMRALLPALQWEAVNCLSSERAKVREYMKAITTCIEHAKELDLQVLSWGEKYRM